MKNENECTSFRACMKMANTRLPALRLDGTTSSIQMLKTKMLSDLQNTAYHELKGGKYQDV